jgi:DNA (cytosine-5)-methyltransferase 1
MRELALFAGAGGGMLASHLLGWRTVCAVEIDSYCQQRLLDRQRDGCLPRFPIWDDVQTFDGHPWRGHVDIITGGFPCQDISAAGQGAGIAGSRSGLVFEMLRIADEVRPSFVFAENSPQLRTKGLATIVERFISMGYVGRVGVLGAGDIGANHERKRMWIIAVSKGIVCRQRGARGSVAGIERQQQFPFLSKSSNSQGEQVGPGGQSRRREWMGGLTGDDVLNPNRVRGLQQEGRILQIGQWFGYGIESQGVARITDWWSLPRFAGVDDGLADRMDRIKATGNGQVPGVAALVWSVLTSDLTAVNQDATV